MNSHKSIFKRNNGFTLTEIVVVMVLLGLIIILATSITLIVNHSQRLSQIDSKGESEIVKLRTTFCDWIKLYDSDVYDITVSEREIIIHSTSAFEGSDNVTMDFADGKLSYYENIGYEPTASKTEIIFSAITDVTFELCDSDLLLCTAHLENTDYKILYHIRAAQIILQGD